MTTQLAIYNRALELIGETQLASLTEARSVRRKLDTVWDAGASGTGGVKACLEMGAWNFAMRTVEASYDPDVTPSFGYTYAFSKPSDFMKLDKICSDEELRSPILDYVDEQNHWYCAYDTIYLSFVSNHANYGGDLTIWPEYFIDMVVAYFAMRVSASTTKDDDKTLALEARLKRAKISAKSSDAANQPPGVQPRGSWIRSRSEGNRGDRGSRTTLIG